MNEQTDKNDKSYLPPHQYSTEEAIERAKILTAPDAPGFDKPWALAIMRGLLAGLDTPPSATRESIKHAAELLRFNAGLVRESHTSGDDDSDWSGEPEAEADYRDLIATAQALEPFDEAAWWLDNKGKRDAEIYGERPYVGHSS